MDEHAQNQILNMLNKFFLLVEYAVENLSREHVLPAMSIAGTIAFIVIVSYLLAYLVRVEEESIKKQESLKTKTTGKYGLFVMS